MASNSAKRAPDSSTALRQSASSWGKKLASLRATLWLIALLALGTVIAFRVSSMRTWPLVLPLVLLAVNLIAAVATNVTFRRQAPLLVFHLSLIALLLLVAAGRLTYLNGYVGVTEGATFDGQLASIDAGPWHAGPLADVRFVNDGFTIDYAPGLQRGPTRNLVRWLDSTDRWREATIGDQTPLVIDGYRFYTTFNKGFAPTFEWTDRNGFSAHGSVQLPPYPLKEYSQAVEWTPPGASTPLWIMLDIDETVLDPNDHTAFRLPGNYRLIARSGTDRHELQVGDRIELPEGQLRFMELRSWMGYRVHYDWTLPWLFAACAVGVASLGWHFWSRFSARPWDAA